MGDARIHKFSLIGHFGVRAELKTLPKNANNTNVSLGIRQHQLNNLLLTLKRV
jgi:hypothetical protein